MLGKIAMEIAISILVIIVFSAAMGAIVVLAERRYRREWEEEFRKHRHKLGVFTEMPL